MLDEAAQRVVDVANDANAGKQRLVAAGQELFNLLARASPDQAAQALTILSQGIESANAEQAALVALMCGTLVERGAPPGGMEAPLLRRLLGVTAQARRFYDACKAEIPDDAEDRDERFENARQQKAAALPAEAAAWEL